MPVVVLGLDVAGFTDRDPYVQKEIQKAWPEIVEEACRKARIAEDDHTNPRSQERGDGGFVAFRTSGVHKDFIVADLVRKMGIQLEYYNRYRFGDGRIRLRVALHCGDVYFADSWTGLAVNECSRLLESSPVRNALEDNPSIGLAVIISPEMFKGAVVDGEQGVRVDDYQEVEVKVKEFRSSAWLGIPGGAAAAELVDSLADTEVATLADIYDGRGSATQLLRDAGIDVSLLAPAQVNPWERPLSSMEFWRGVNDSLRSGALPQGRRKILELARYDFFISAVREDESWAQWIAWILSEEGYRVHLDDSSYAHTDDLTGVMKLSRRWLAVLSPAYLKSDPFGSVWKRGWQRDPDHLWSTLVPVRVRGCEPTGVLAKIPGVDLFGLDKNAVRTSLIESARGWVRKIDRPNGQPRTPEMPDAG
ncbi:MULTISPECIES: TIR domain-containing protein [Pseudofrankia]|uniref:TIR domain-containing protein n=1 Tax=Pseudofrankia TaxID=2994363 RepID=UPI000234CD93|nr:MULTISPECIES: TIR domain-containing protein [Pseudofrankia]OHV31560.1 TIR domain-containing protein [Pseudofrankia sp. EUN1h]